MRAALGWRSVVTIVVLVGSILILVTQPLRLGLDLRGGTQVVLEAQDTDDVVVDASVMDRSLEALRRRVDGLGVSEPSLQRSGDRRIIVELPGLDDPDEAVATIGRTGRLSFHPVVGLAPPDAVTGVADADGSVVLADDDGVLIQLGPPVLEGADVSDAQVDLTGATWAVSVDFANGGAWAALTGAAACAPPGDPQRRVAIVLDGDVLTSPQVGAEVGCQVGIQGGSTVITGQFTESDARELALLIRSGALPVPLEIIAQNTVGPTLGAAAIDAELVGRGDRQLADGAVPDRLLPVSRCPRSACTGGVRGDFTGDVAGHRGCAHVARHRRLRAGDRDGRRRQRVGVRAHQRGARSGAHLAELGARWVPPSVHSDRRLQRHHIGRSVVAVLLRLRRRARLRYHACRSVCSHRCSRRWWSPG